MYIPNPYFSNIPQMGDLILDYIFVEDGYPILFVCKSYERYFLCVCRTLIPAQKWIVSEILLDDLKKLLKGEIDIHDAFISNKNGKSCIVKWRPTAIKVKYRVRPTSSLNLNEIPEKGIFLDEDEIGNYLEQLENRVSVEEENNVRMESVNEQYIATDIKMFIDISFLKNICYNVDDSVKKYRINTAENVSFFIEEEIINDSDSVKEKKINNVVKTNIAPAA